MVRVLPPEMTEPLRRAIQDAQMLCDPSRVRLVDVFIGLCRGRDATGAVLRDIGLNFSDMPRRRGFLDQPVPSWPRAEWDEMVKAATGEAARRRHRGVGSAHVALVLLDDPEVAEFVPDADLARRRLSDFLDEVSLLGGATRYRRPEPGRSDDAMT